MTSVGLMKMVPIPQSIAVACTSEVRVRLPDGQWKLLSDGVSSALWKGPSRVCGGEVTLLPCSATIFGQV